MIASQLHTKKDFNILIKTKEPACLKPDYPVHFYCLLFTYKLPTRANEVRSAFCSKAQVAKQKLTHRMSHQRGESGRLSVEKNNTTT